MYNELLKDAKPILFSTPMVQAIIDGRKTMTRRIVNPQPRDKNNVLRGFVTSSTDNKIIDCANWATDEMSGYDTDYRKPRYKPGDILYVRETWAKEYVSGLIMPEYGDSENILIYKYKASDQISTGIKWRPSIHMPKEAARIFLRVTNVGAERLQDISPGDCLDEGVINDVCRKCLCEAGSCRPQHAEDEFCGGEDGIVDEYATLWDKINFKRGYGWDTNPWVWVYKFERVKKGGQE